MLTGGQARADSTYYLYLGQRIAPHPGLACRFGTFEPRERAARKGRNPQTQEIMDLPASKSPAFTPSKVLICPVNDLDMTLLRMVLHPCIRSMVCGSVGKMHSKRSSSH